MKITYLDHSGFAVECGDTLLVFDEYNPKPAQGKSGLAGGVVTEADVRALVLDSASPLTEEDKAALFGLAPQMIVLSKGDLAQRLTATDVRAAFGDVPMVTVCATRGEGMEALRDALTAFVPADGAESSALSQARHVEAAGRARAALCDAVTAIEDGMPLDVAAVDLSAALDALGEITGETMSERVIDEVFAKFCVGK